MTYLDISCLSCGPFRHNGPRKLAKCPHCGGFQVTVTPHDYDTDQRFKNERQRPNDEY